MHSICSESSNFDTVLYDQDSSDLSTAMRELDVFVRIQYPDLLDEQSESEISQPCSQLFFSARQFKFVTCRFWCRRTQS